MLKKLLLLLAVAGCQAPGASTSQTSSPELSLGDSAQSALASGNNNDYFYDTQTTQDMMPAPGGSTVTGLDYTQFYGGDAIVVRNAGTGPLTLASDSSLSQTGNQFHFPGGQDLVLFSGESVWLQNEFDDLGGWYPIGPVKHYATFSTPSRSLGSAFQPSTIRDVEVHYSVSITSTLTLSGGQSGHIDLWVGPTSSLSGTNSVASIAGGSTGSVVVGVALTAVNGGELTFRVPRGYWAEIVGVNVTSTPTFSLVAQSEEAL